MTHREISGDSAIHLADGLTDNDCRTSKLTSNDPSSRSIHLGLLRAAKSCASRGREAKSVL
jgi:hypothetical protein